jgi:hypothetical protein
MVDLQSLLIGIAVVSVVLGTAYHVLTSRKAEKDRKIGLETRQKIMFIHFGSSSPDCLLFL